MEVVSGGAGRPGSRLWVCLCVYSCLHLWSCFPHWLPFTGHQLLRLHTPLSELVYWVQLCVLGSGVEVLVQPLVKYVMDLC